MPEDVTNLTGLQTGTELQLRVEVEMLDVVSQKGRRVNQFVLLV